MSVIDQPSNLIRWNGAGVRWLRKVSEGMEFRVHLGSRC
jgi:hypothetical protein